MQCLYILLTPESVQYGVGFFSTLRLFHGTVKRHLWHLEFSMRQAYMAHMEQRQRDRQIERQKTDRKID